MHWIDSLIEDIHGRRGEPIVIATGVTPSGHIHVGNMREMVIGTVLCQAAQMRGWSTRLITIVDTYDPLRKRYPFLPEVYENYVGQPISDIPDPAGCCSSYAEHFLKPFFNSMLAINMVAEVIHSDRAYKEGRYADAIAQALAARDKIAQIISQETGRQLEPDWYPAQVKCAQCKKLTTSKIMVVKDEGVEYKCACGNEGFGRYDDGGVKLPWRVDWPVRWRTFGITVEPFGKDHAAAGGSYDTGKRIAQEVYGFTPPEPIPYEWIELKGKGPMSSSAGIVVKPADILAGMPPEVFRYLMLRTPPQKHISFDPEMGLLRLIEEYEEGLSKMTTSSPTGDEYDIMRSLELSLIPSRPTPLQPIDLPFKHLVTLVQVAGGCEEEKLLPVLQRAGYGPVAKQRWAEVQQKATYAWNWAERFASPEARFSLEVEVDNIKSALSTHQKLFLKLLAEYVSTQLANPPAADTSAAISARADALHQAIYDLAEKVQIPPQTAFSAIYRAFLGKERGPRAGWFLASLDSDFLRQRIEQVTEEAGEAPRDK